MLKLMEEWLDVVNTEDQVIGRIERNQLHARALAQGTAVRVINIIVRNKEGKILLPLRSADRRIFPNCYDFGCGEHVQEGESYADAAIRGLEEELGLRGVSLQEVLSLSPLQGVSNFMRVYIAEAEGPFAYDTKGIASLEWCMPSVVEEMIHAMPQRFKGDYIPVFRILRWKGLL